MKKKLTKHILFFAIFIFLFSMGQLERIQVSDHAAFYLHDLLLTIWIVVTLYLQPRFETFLSQFLKKLPKVFLIFLVWVGVGLIAQVFLKTSFSSLVVALLYLARLTLYGTAGILIAYLIKTKELSKQIILSGLLVGCLEVLVLGFVQYFLMPDTRFLFFLGWDDHYYRLISTFLDPGFTGIILVLGFFLLQNFQQQKISAVLSLGFLSGILLTYSRASYLGLLVGIGILATDRYVKKDFSRMFFYVVAAGIFLLAVPFLPRPAGEGVKLERTSTAVSRIDTMSAVLSSMQGQDWLIGKGLFLPQHTGENMYGPDHAVISDNWIVFILGGTGFIGLAFFSLTVIKILLQSLKTNIFFFASVVAVFVHGLFNASVFYPFVVLFLVMQAAALKKFSRDS